MSRRRIGQESFGFGEAGRRHSSLDDLSKVIDWARVDRRLAEISCAAKGEPAWPPLALFNALLLAVWYDLSDVKLAEALDDHASFRRFCGFSGADPTSGTSRSTAFAAGSRRLFGTWKRSYGLRRIRWLGLAKAALQIRLTAIAYNMRRTPSILAVAA